MPITPLHFGILAPINAARSKRVKLLPFFLVNAIMDLEAFFQIVLGIPSEAAIHGPETHSFLGAIRIALMIGVLFILTKDRLEYFSGALIGGISHVFLDMMCHPEMKPLYPFIEGNPYYIPDGLAWVSNIMLILTAWWLAQEIVHARRNRRDRLRDQVR